MINSILADKIHDLLFERKTFLRVSTAIILLEEDPELIAETMHAMKRIRPELFNIVYTNELIISTNEAFAYDARRWRRDGGFTFHSRYVQKNYKEEFESKVFTAQQLILKEDNTLTIDHKINEIALTCLKICAIAICVTVIMRYLGKF